jgi:predicted molibdopterin-dependent oxidoreductase YjgC
MKRFRRGRLPLSDGDGIRRGSRVTVQVDGQPVLAYEGESVAAVLVAQEGLATRTTVSGAPRGIFCGMGVCYDCLVVVDGVPNTRACMTPVQTAMRIDRQSGVSSSS